MTLNQITEALKKGKRVYHRQLSEEVRVINCNGTEYVEVINNRLTEVDLAQCHVFGHHPEGVDGHYYHFPSKELL